MKIFCLTDLRLPDSSMASGNRLLHMMRMLSEQDIQVEILTHFLDTGNAPSCAVGGVRIIPFGHVRQHPIQRCVEYYFLTPARMLRYLWRHRKSEVVLYSYGMAPGLKVWAYLISRLVGCPLCQESSELPASVYQNASKWKQFFETVLLQKFYDAKVVMTDNLNAYYKRFARRSCKFIKIPMTVDWQKFAQESRPNPLGHDYIAYTGSMERIGGGVDIVVKSFVAVASEYEHLRLLLMGKGSDRTKRNLEALVPEGIRNRVDFLFSGDVPSADIPMYIKNARVLLALPLPTVQQEGCFPTKLGEYLACGVPTVLSRVGNPVQVMTDRTNVYFVPPGDVEATAHVLREILNDYASACIIARRGQAFAREQFDYRNFGSILAKWMKEEVSA